MPAEQKFISSTLTWTGIQIRKYVGKKWPSYPKSAPALTKIIEYPETSRMAQMGIDKVFIENAGKYGKRFSYYSGSDCLFSGLSKGPGSEAFKDQLRHYFKMKKPLVTKPVSKIHENELSVTTTASGTKIKRVLCEEECGRSWFHENIYYPANGQGTLKYCGKLNDELYRGEGRQYIVTFKDPTIKEIIVSDNNELISRLRDAINNLRKLK